MQYLHKAIETANIEGKNWKNSILKFPAQLLFNREIVTKLPQLIQNTASNELETKDYQVKEQTNRHVDEKRQRKKSHLKEGDFSAQTTKGTQFSE